MRAKRIELCVKRGKVEYNTRSYSIFIEMFSEFKSRHKAPATLSPADCTVLAKLNVLLRKTGNKIATLLFWFYHLYKPLK